MLVLISGLPGSGKSYFGQELANAIDAVYLNSDKVRIQMNASGKYQEKDKLSVYRQMISEASKAIDAGRHVVVDATFYKRSFRELFEKLAESRGTPQHIIEVRADEPTIRRRLSSGREFSEADYKVYETIRDEFEEITVPHLVLTSTNSNIEEMLHKAIEYTGHASGGN
jgi:predicted kinase